MHLHTVIYMQMNDLRMHSLHIYTPYKPANKLCSQEVTHICIQKDASLAWAIRATQASQGDCPWDHSKPQYCADPQERTQASHPWLSEPNSYRHVRLAISPLFSFFPFCYVFQCFLLPLLFIASKSKEHNDRCGRSICIYVHAHQEYLCYDFYPSWRIYSLAKAYILQVAYQCLHYILSR